MCRSRLVAAIAATTMLMLAACSSDGENGAVAQVDDSSATIASQAEQSSTDAATSLLAVAEDLVDVLVSEDSDRLAALMGDAPSADIASYYQLFSVADDFEVVDRQPCKQTGRKAATCEISGIGNIGRVLHDGESVTDQLSVGIDDAGDVILFTFETTDGPPVGRDAFRWAFDNRVSWTSGVCNGFMSSGPTPEECAAALLDAMEEFVALEE